MEYLNNVVQYFLPTPEEGCTAVIREYKDDIGKIVKISIEIIPTVVTTISGPVGGAIVSTLAAGGKAAKALYDYITTPTSSDQIKTLQSSKESQTLSQAGAVVLTTAMHIIRERGGKAPTNPDIIRLKSHKETLGLLEKGLKGSPDALINKIALSAFDVLIPEIVVELFQQGAEPIRKILKYNDLINNFSELTSAIGGLHNKIKTNWAEKVAEELVHAEELTRKASATGKRGEKVKGKRVLSEAKTIEKLRKHALETTASYGKQNQSSSKKAHAFKKASSSGSAQGKKDSKRRR